MLSIGEYDLISALDYVKKGAGVGLNKIFHFNNVLECYIY